MDNSVLVDRVIWRHFPSFILFLVDSSRSLYMYVKIHFVALNFGLWAGKQESC